jgi:two-component system, OmpR family, heavy metal sensor histidine kinase CusS
MTPTRSIGTQLSWHLAVQMAIGLGILCGGIYWVTCMLLATKQNDVLREKSGLLVDIVSAVAARSDEREVVDKMAFYAPRRPGTRLEILRADGSVLYRDPTDAAHALSSHVSRTDFEVNTRLPGSPWRGSLAIDIEGDVRLLRGLALTLLVATLAGATFVGIATFWRVKRGLASLRDLAKQTRAISPQRLDQRLALRAPAEELQPWINQFNHLMGRLERAYVQLEGFNADVAHELRTPLATLIGHTELALSRERPAQALRETLTSNLEELQRLSVMVNDMLFLSQADRGATARRGEPVSLAALARQVVEFHEATLDEAGLVVHVDGDAAVGVDEALFKRAVSNLLGNATRFAERGSVVRIVIDTDAPQQVRVTVQNAGVAIEPVHLPQLFTRFFRADASRQDVGQHHGLGLAIVAAIARMHAGTPLAESTDGTTRVGFTLAVR